ncbi:uncharacterized protein [Engystomops pustulosus]|uniref:uncharacterized protein n=1 Tax=Engystomops pustulosus TaxID=76066 RepID=UPI003AFB6BB4
MAQSKYVMQRSNRSQDQPQMDGEDCNSLPIYTRIQRGIYTWHSSGNQASSSFSSTQAKTPAVISETSGRQWIDSSMKNVDYNSLPIYTRIQHGVYTWSSGGQQVKKTTKALPAQEPACSYVRNRSTQATTDGRGLRATQNSVPKNAIDYNSLPLYERIQHGVYTWRSSGQQTSNIPETPEGKKQTCSNDRSHGKIYHQEATKSLLTAGGKAKGRPRESFKEKDPNIKDYNSLPIRERIQYGIFTWRSGGH